MSQDSTFIENQDASMGSQTEDFRFLAQIDELEEHGQVSKWVGDHDILLYRHEGELKALSNICPHFGGPVGFRKAIDGKFYCLWHNWEFSCQDGSCNTNPGMKLREYQIKVEGDKVYVNLLG